MASLTMIQQAVKLREMLPRSTMSDGAPIGKSFMEVTPDDRAVLIGIADRLERMSVHETEIRRLVMRG